MTREELIAACAAVAAFSRKTRLLSLGEAQVRDLDAMGSVAAACRAMLEACEAYPMKDAYDVEQAALRAAEEAHDAR